MVIRPNSGASSVVSGPTIGVVTSPVTHPVWQNAGSPQADAGLVAVASHLRPQVVDRFELALVTEVLDEAHFRLLAVEVAVPVEQVRLEQAVRLGFVELGPPPERDRRRVDLPRRALVPAGVDAVGR